MAQKENILRLIEVNQKVATGIAMGMIAGYNTFVTEVAKGDHTKRGFDNSLLHGSLMGWIEFLDKAGEAVNTAWNAAGQTKKR